MLEIKDLVLFIRQSAFLEYEITDKVEVRIPD